MKLITFFLILTNYVFVSAQDANSGKARGASTEKDTKYEVLILNNRDYFYNVRDDQMFVMNVIKKISDNEYWIKSGMIYNADEKALLNFDTYLKNEKGENMVHQVQANYGYIIELIDNSKSNTTSFAVSIADQNGERISDELVFNTNNYNTFTFK